MVRKSPTSRRLATLAQVSRRLRVPVLVLICALGVLLSVVMARRTARSDRRMLDLRFTEAANARLLAISHAVTQSMEQVRTLASFLRSDRPLSRSDFASFVLPTLRRHPNLRSMAWVAKVPDADRRAFEQALSDIVGRPIAIKQDSLKHRRAGGPMRAQADSFPVAFAEPREKVGGLLGFDESSAPRRREALMRAARTGRLVITPPVALNHHGSDRPRMGVVAFAPIYHDGEPPATDATDQEVRHALLGFATAELRLSDVIESSLRYWKQPDLQVALFDRSLPRGDQPLYVRYADRPHGTPALPGDRVGASSLRRSLAMPRPPANASGLIVNRRCSVGGRPWVLTATPTPHYLARVRTGRAWWMLLAGLAITTLVTAVLGSMVYYSDRLSAFAAERELINAELRQRIAEREEAEAVLAQANAELREVNADMEQFVGAVSHDLKSPLIAAEMLIHVLEQAVANENQQRIAQTSGQIGKACGRMRRIIDDLLDHQKAGFMEKTEPVEMIEVALHVIEEHREEATRRHAHLHVQEDMPVIRGDRGRLTAMLDNLVANALKYGVKDTSSPRIDVGWERDKEHLRLFVRDNGPGIPEEHRDRLWGLFERQATDDEGTGIGLAIVRRVAEAHGGGASVECPPAEEGGGTIFWIKLPADRVIDVKSRRHEPDDTGEKAEPATVQTPQPPLQTAKSVA